MTYAGDGAYFIAIGAILGGLLMQLIYSFFCYIIPKANSKDRNKELKERVKKLREEFAE